MRIGVVSIMPEMYRALTQQGVVGRAIADGRVTFGIFDPRNATTDRHRTVDDKPYGGGPGMIMMAPPIAAAIGAAKAMAGSRARVIYATPGGRRLDHAGVMALAREPALIFLAGRYEGIDERVIEREVDEEISIGDYVLSGGDLAVMVMIDAVMRQLPGVLGNEASRIDESFVDGVLECAHYTRPEEVDGQRPPGVLTSGDHAAVESWRRRSALVRTWHRRPDLLARRVLTAAERAEFRAYFKVLGAERERGVDDEKKQGH